MLSTTLKNTVNLQTITANHRYVVQSLSAVHRAESVHAAVRSGLASRPKTLPPILFYDERGSRLFEEISELPEYYLTRTEQAILDRYASEMVTYCAHELLLVELGSGSSTKTRTFLDALFAGDHRPIYQPVDISESMLHATAEELVGEYPDLVVRAIASDYDRGLVEVGEQQGRQKVLLFLGSNLGNFSQTRAQEFLRSVRQSMAPDDILFLGVDLLKPWPILQAAYDDTRGVTAAFNRNVLVRLNRELHANFNLDRFRHEVVWNDDVRAVEMHLKSQGQQTAYLRDLDLLVEFDDGETIHTESSHKFTPDSLDELCGSAGLRVKKSWTDEQGWFALNLIVPVRDSLA